MRIYCDIQAIQSPGNADRGIGRYVGEFARAVEENHPGVVEGWLLNPLLPTPSSAVGLMHGAAVRLQDDPDLRSPDVWHVLSPFESLGSASVDLVWPQWARSNRTRLFVTLYDLIPLIYADRYLVDPALRRAYMSRLRLVQHADHVLAISRATADDAIRLLGIPPRRLHVVGTGVSEHFVPPDDRDVVLKQVLQDLPALRPGYVLYTGGIDFRKNIEGLLTAYARLQESLRQNHQLVIVCRVRPEEREHLEQRARALGVHNDFLLTGYVPDDVLLRIYQAAHLFVFPSLYEGFGLPVVEALSCGVPAIVGRNSSLTELVDDPNAWFDASVVEDIARALHRALGDHSFRATLVRSSTDHDYRWNVVAERTLAVYAEAVDRRPRKSTQPRIALVSPMPPAASGVADYSWQLLRELAARASVDVFTSPDAHQPRLTGVRWYSYGQMSTAIQVGGDYDLKLYAMGNSEFHVECLDLLRRHGGTVIAHDIRYTGFFSVVRAHSPSSLDEDTRKTLDRLQSGRLPEHLEQYDLDAGLYYRTNDLLCAPIAAAAGTMLVHSATAATLARLNLSPAHRTKVQIAPFGHRLRARPDGVVPDTVATFGIVDKVKRSDDIVDAFIALARRYPRHHFAVVGRCFDDALRVELHDKIRAAGLADRISLTDRVDETAYDGWLSRSLLAVQLRAHTNGESSAAVADCLGAGVPTIVSRLGSMAELGDACMQLPPDATTEDLIRVVSSLLDDDRLLDGLARRGLAYARDNSFATVAECLVAQANQRVGVGVNLSSGA